MKHIEFPKTGFLRLPEVLKIFPVSKSSWYLGVKTGKYPKPVKLSENISAWLAEDILALIEQTKSQIYKD